MVLERLISLRMAVRQPVWMFFIGAIISAICMAISFFIFQTSIGMFTTLLITLAMTPFMVNLVRYEEDKEEQSEDIEKMNFLQRHSDTLKVYSAFFVGMTLSMVAAYLILPQALVESIFNDQTVEIQAIRGNIVFFNTFQEILINNFGVLFLSFLLSFLFGAGAVFILAWNASVLAAAIGIAAKQFGGVGGLPQAILVFFPHGSLEILAYFIAGIAGGLISTVILRRHSKKFWFVIEDSFQLMAIAAVILVVAAVIESFLITF